MDAQDFASEQLKSINAHLRVLFTAYFAWYAFFWTLSGAILALGIVSDDADGMSTTIKVAIVLLLVILTIESICVSVIVRIDARNKTRDVKALAGGIVEQLLSKDGIPSCMASVMKKETHASMTWTWALHITTISLSCLLVLWLIVLIQILM